MAQISYGTITVTDTTDIESITVEYARNQSTSSAPDSGWSTTRPTWAEGYYIWQRSRIHKSGTLEEEDEFGTAVCITGSKGDDGRGLTNTETKYTNVAEGTTKAQIEALQDNAWVSDVPSYDSSKPDYWVRIKNTYDKAPLTEYIYYKDNATSNALATAALANSIATHSNENAQGAMSQANNGIKEIYRIWYRTNSSISPKDRSPATWPPSAHVTTSNNDVNNTWTKVKPIDDINNRYYFYCNETITNGGISSWTDPVLDTSNLSQYEIGALETKVKNHWWDSEGAHIASGIKQSGDTEARAVTEGDYSTYGFNAVTKLTGISFNYNAAKVIDLSTTPSPTSLKFYQPPTISNNTATQGQLTMALTSNALSFYDPTDGITEQAKLDTNGLILEKGGITAGDAGQPGFIYLSTEDYPLKDEANNIQGFTINGWTPSVTGTREGQLSNDPAWRQIIGTKFGVDADGNLYANDAHLSNASVEGAITATSLTIGGSGDNTYNGIDAINVTGYSIEIKIGESGAEPNTVYLYPILYHNGMEITPPDYTHFLWYYADDDIAQAIATQGLPDRGKFLATYGYSYKVIYDFESGEVGDSVVTRDVLVDPQKYITKISDTGITIHPEIIASNLGYVQIDGNGLKIKQTISDAININNDITLANYGNTITIGQSNSKNVFIDSNGVNIKNGSTILSNFGETITIGQSGNKNVFIDSNGVNIKNGSNILANFGNTITIGQNTSGHTVINTNGMEIFTDTNTSIANFTKENNSFKVRIGLENDARMEITPTSFLAVSAETVEGFKIEMDAPGLDYPVSITPWNTYIVNDNYVIKTYGIAPLGQQLSVSDCESRWVTTKTVTSITNISSNATANFKYYAGEYTVTLAKVDSNDYIFGINKNEILSATVNFNDNTTQIIQFTISYSSPRTWTFQATATTSLLEFRLMQIPTVTYELEVSTALTSGIRTYGSAKGAFSSVIGEELIATSEAHAAFGRYNNDTLVDPHYLIASFGKGKNELERSNAAAIGFYNPNYDYEVASIYLGLDEAAWLGFMDQPLTPATDDAVIIEAMSNLGWINFDSTTYDCSNKSGSYMLANYYDRSDE